MSAEIEKRTMSQRAQAAYESLARGIPVPAQEYEAMAGEECPFTIQQGNNSGIFHFGEHQLALGSATALVTIRARTAAGSELFHIGFDGEGRANFSINHLAELIEDPR